MEDPALFDLDLRSVTLPKGEDLKVRCDIYGRDHGRVNFGLLMQGIPGPPPIFTEIVRIPENAVSDKDFDGMSGVNHCDEPDSSDDGSTVVPMPDTEIVALSTAPLKVRRTPFTAGGDLEVLAHTWRIQDDLLVFYVTIDTSPATDFDIAFVRIEYNTDRPHGSLDFVTPEAYRQQWTHQQSATQPTLS